MFIQALRGIGSFFFTTDTWHLAQHVFRCRMAWLFTEYDVARNSWVSHLSSQKIKPMSIIGLNIHNKVWSILLQYDQCSHKRSRLRKKKSKRKNSILGALISVKFICPEIRTRRCLQNDQGLEKKSPLFCLPGFCQSSLRSVSGRQCK